MSDQLSDQLNLAHLAEKYEKEETKTNLRQCPLSSVQVQDPWRQSGRVYGNKVPKKLSMR